VDEIKEYVAEHPELQSAMFKTPHAHGIVGTSANYVVTVAKRMSAENWRPNRQLRSSPVAAD
jgi:hypothetical protein